MHDKPEIDVSVYRFSVFFESLDRLTDVIIQALPCHRGALVEDPMPGAPVISRFFMVLEGIFLLICVFHENHIIRKMESGPFLPLG